MRNCEFAQKRHTLAFKFRALKTVPEAANHTNLKADSALMDAGISPFKAQSLRSNSLLKHQRCFQVKKYIKMGDLMTSQISMSANVIPSEYHKYGKKQYT